jgi:hypothetical protein
MLRTVLLLLPLLLALVPATQTATDFAARYGNPDAERFVVRPGITMTVAYGDDQSACQMVIEPAHSIIRRDEPAKYMRPDVVTAILDEVLPPPDRGAQLRRLVTKSGCNDIEITEYENATISRTTHRCTQNPEIEGEATVTRKDPSCGSVFPPQEPLP